MLGKYENTAVYNTCTNTNNNINCAQNYCNILTEKRSDRMQSLSRTCKSDHRIPHNMASILDIHVRNYKDEKLTSIAVHLELLQLRNCQRRICRYEIFPRKYSKLIAMWSDEYDNL